MHHQPLNGRGTLHVCSQHPLLISAAATAVEVVALNGPGVLVQDGGLIGEGLTIFVAFKRASVFAIYDSLSTFKANDPREADQHQRMLMLVSRQRCRDTTQSN